MPFPVYAWTAVLVALARILHLRLAFATPGVTLTVPVPLAIIVVLAAVTTVVFALACKAILQAGVVRSPA
jgi:hypothetical protein